MIATLGRLALAAVALLVLRRALRRGAAPPRRRRHPSPWRVASSRVALALRAHRRERAMLRVLGRPLPSLGLPPLPPELLGALFVGHTAPDLDSIAAAIGAACLFAGTPAVAGELNAESAFALAHWGLPCPAPIGELLASDARARVCLVDHNQRSQLAPALRACPDRVCGVIDHHALQDDAIVTAAPIFATLRPWGSAASIVAHMALEHGVRLPPPIAGVLLSAILSDTLNLRSPTTTDYDRKLLSLLATLSATADVERLARHQFRAKSKALDALSSHALLVGDLKVFELGGGRSSAWAGSVGVSVVETTAPDGLLARAPGLAREMIRLKSEEGLQLLFAFIVDVSALRSHLVLCGRAEASLAHASYGGDARDADGRDGDEADGHRACGPGARECPEASLLVPVGELVSRKKQLLPPLARAIDGGWQPPAPALVAGADASAGVDAVGALEAAAMRALATPDEVLIDDRFDGRLVRFSELPPHGHAPAHGEAAPSRSYLRAGAMAAVLCAAGAGGVAERRAVATGGRT